jgi:hypothetical protein
VALTVFAVLCQLQTLARADAQHYALAALPSILLLAPFLARPGLRSFSLLAGVSTLTFAIPVAVVASGVFAGPPGRDEALAQAAHATSLATARTDRIFVGLTDTRHAFLNALIGYYLADRAPGTPETMFNPGITNRGSTQAKMVTQLEASDTRVLLLDDAFARWTEPENESRIAGSGILDAFVAREYGTMCVFGPYRVMTRVGAGADVAPCPDAAGMP